MGVPENAHLRVLEEGVLVVDAAPAAVLPRVVVPCPGPTQLGLLPRLVDAQVRRVEQAALDDVGEVSAHVLESHPGRGKGMSQAGLLAGPPLLALYTLTTTHNSEHGQGITQTRHTSSGLSFLVCKLEMDLTTAPRFTELVWGLTCNKSML